MRPHAVWILISLISLSGCAGATTTLHRDPTGKIWKVETEGQAETFIKQGDEEIRQDTKAEPWLKITPPDMVLGKIGA